MFISEELTQAGYTGRLEQLWLTYQHYLQQSDSEEKQNELVPSDQLDNMKPRGLNIQDDMNMPGKRKLLYYLNESETGGVFYAADENFGTQSEVMTEHKSREDDSFVDVVDIQPDTVKLFPWEHGSLRRLQEVGLLFFCQYLEI